MHNGLLTSTDGLLTKVQATTHQGTIALAKDNKFHARTKHIDLRYHFIREAVEDGKIVVKYVPTDDNVLDVFTKALPKPKFQKMVELLGLRRL